MWNETVRNCPSHLLNTEEEKRMKQKRLGKMVADSDSEVLVY